MTANAESGSENKTSQSSSLFQHKKYHITNRRVRVKQLGQKQLKNKRIGKITLSRLIQCPPPRIEYVSPIEIYLLDESLSRTKRVCGQENIRLPAFVPDSMDNPHGVSSPVSQYVCLQHAGKGTAFEGIGPCRKHIPRFMKKYHHNDGIYADTIEGLIAQLIKRDYLKANTMVSVSKLFDDPEDEDQEDGKTEGGTLKLDLSEFERKAREQFTPDELLDVFRSLYQIEGVKLAIIELMKTDGVSLERLESVADQIVKSANYQAAMAKRDLALMQTKAVAAITQTFITGMLSIVMEEVSPEAAIRVLQRFRSDLVLPVDEQGYTELLRRQRAAGLDVAVGKLIEAEFETEDDDGEAG